MNGDETSLHNCQGLVENILFGKSTKAYWVDSQYYLLAKSLTSATTDSDRRLRILDSRREQSSLSHAFVLVFEANTPSRFIILSEVMVR